MIVYIPYYSKESSIYDIFDEIKEFESVDKMKEYLLKYWTINKTITKDNIIIDKSLSCENDELGLKDQKMVCLKIGRTTRVIGYCATEYKDLNEKINKTKQEYKKLTNLYYIITKMECENYFHFGEYAEEKVCLFKRDNLWEVYYSEKGNIFDKIECEELKDACIEVISKLSRLKEKSKTK